MGRLPQKHVMAGRDGPHTDGHIQIFLADAVGELNAAFHVLDALGRIHALSEGTVKHGYKLIAAESDGKLIIVKFLQKFF